MHRWVKRICSMICILAVLTSLLSVLGCEKQSGSLSGDNKEYSAYFSASLYPITSFLDNYVEYSAVFSEEQAILIHTRFPDGYWEADKRYFAEGSDVTHGGYTDEDGDPIAPSYSLEVYSYSGTLAYTVSLDDYFSLSWERPVVTLCEDGTILVVMTCANTSNLEVVYEYAYFDASGNLVGEVSQLQAQEYMMFLSSTGLSCSGTSGNIYLAGERATEEDTTEGCIFVYSHEGTWMKTIPLTNTTMSLVTVGGSVYVASSSVDEEDMCVLLLAEIQADFTLGTPYVIPQGELEYDTITGDASCVYLTNSQEVVRYSLDTQETNVITNFTDSDIQKDNIVSIACLSGDRIALLGISPAVGNYDLIVLNGQDTDPNTDKQILTLGGVDITDDPIINEIVSQFNLTHTDYRMVIMDYGAAYSYLDYPDADERYDRIYEDFNLSFLTGDGPDILVDPYNILPFLSISNDRSMVDMTQYLYSDPDIDVSEYQENQFAASQIDGKLYSLPSAYSIYGLLSSPEYASDGWTTEEFADIESSAGDDIVPISGSSQEDLLQGALYYTLDEYVNCDTGEVTFDSDSFANLLAWSKAYGDQSGTDSYAAIGQVASGNAIYCAATITDVYDFTYDYDSLFSFDFSLSPFPSDEEESLCALPVYRFAITTQCDCPDIAWDCVSLLLSENIQKVLSRVYIPLRYDALEQANQDAIDEFAFWGSSDTSNAEEWANKFTAYATSATSVGYADMDMIRLILEEAAPYFAGQKTADEVSALIQNRVQTLVDERQ